MDATLNRQQNPFQTMLSNSDGGGVWTRSLRATLAVVSFFGWLGARNCASCLFLMMLFAGTSVFAQNITTLAGNGLGGFGGDGGPATSASLYYAQDVAVDSAGNLYVADSANNRIRKITAATGIITTIAGDGTPGFSGDNGPATSARLNDPRNVAVDGAGNVYIADSSNNRIRKITAATGVITTFAGNGTSGFSGDNVLATSTRLAGPKGVAVDSAGDVYVADFANSRIRKISATTGIITTVAGNGTSGFSGDGLSAIDANTSLNFPWGVAVDGAGNIYVVDASNSRVRKITAATGVINTVAGNGTNGYSGDNGAATGASISARGIAVDSAGNLYIADYGNHRIRKVAAATGIITTYAGNGLANFGGDDGPAINANLNLPSGVVVDGAGKLYVADAQNFRIRKITLVAPDAPTIDAVTGGDQQVTVSFTAPTSDGGSSITGYTATCGTRSNTGTASPIVVSNLTNGVSVTCRVSATNAIGTGALSAASNGVVPNVPQTITFAAQPAQTYSNGGVFSLTPFPTASSGLWVTLSSTTPSICTISAVSNIEIVAAGTCVINADQSGNAAFMPAPQVSRSITINKRDQTISIFDCSGCPLFATGQVGALSTFIAGSSLPVTVTSLTPSVCSVTNSSGWRVQGLIGGTCTLAANQAGNANYNPASQVTLDITVNKLPQLPLFSLNVDLPLTFGQPARTASVNGGSGTGAITFSATGNCAITGNSVVATGAGACTITATKAADAVYESASVSQTFTVQKATQSPISVVFATNPIGFGASTTMSITGGGGSGAVTFSTSSSACTINGTTVTAVSLGGCTVIATKDADANYLSGTGSGGLSIVQATPTLTFPVIADQMMGSASFVVTASSNSGVTPAIFSVTPSACTASGNGSATVVLLNVGTCTLRANVNSTTNYTNGQLDRSFNITQGTQTITFGTLPTVVVGGTGTLLATGGQSSLPINFASTTPGVCTVAGSTVTGVSFGSCAITANQAGNANYAAASQVSTSLTIGRANQTINFGAPPSISNGQSDTISATGGASGNPVVFASTSPSACSVSGNTVTAGYTGTCVIIANQAGNANYNAAPQASLSFDIVSGSWTSTASMSIARVDHTMTRLANGKVLVSGGADGPASYGSTAISSAELYDPATGLWSAAPNMAVSRSLHTATLLLDGTVLVLGGWDPFTGVARSSGARYNPTTNTWTNVANMPSARRSHTATRLADGSVVVIGGYDDLLGNVDSIVRYDPGTNAWTTLGTSSQSFFGHTATMLQNGKILLAGGQQDQSGLYDPASNSMSVPAGASYFSAQYPTSQLLPDGTVVLFGDSSNGNVMLYNASTNTWSTRAVSPNSPAVSALLGSGKVLTAAWNFINGGGSAALYNPGLDAWQATGNIVTARYGGASVVLDSGRVLVAGGADGSYAAMALAEVYDPGNIVPSAPRIGTAAAGSASATVTFTSLPGQGITSFTAISAPGGFTGSCAAPCSSITINGLVGGPFTFTVTATNPIGTSAPSAASNAVTLQAGSQAIVLGTNPGPVTYSLGGTFAVSATGGASGNPVTFSSTTTGVCTTGGTNGSTVTILTAGTCTIAGDQAGNASYTAAPQVTQTIVINKANQSALTATSTSTSLVIGQTATLGSTGGSGIGAVSFSSNNANCTVSGSNLTAAAVGGCIITATKAADSNYNQAVSAGLAITVNAAPLTPQTITFGTAPTVTVGATGTVSATGGGSGNPVTFTSITPTICTVSGTNGSTVTGVAVGTCTITANQAGSANYNAAPQATQSFSVTAAATTFTVTPSAGANGTITPSTPVVVNSGATSTFTVTPNSGYSASVGGTCGGSLVGTTYTTNAITANCTVIASFSLNIALNAVQSRKTHGAAGTFDLAIDTTPLIGGAITVEPRVIGAGHQIVFQFNQAVTSIGSATAIDINSNAIGSASAVINSLNNAEVIVTLTGVADVSRVTVSLNSVVGAQAGTMNATASLGFLVGDVNNSRSVNSSDINGIKNRAGQALDTSNFKFDLNASGGINTTDINSAKSRAGGVL
ncbi:MAG: hypothetical protein ING75_01940 [Rhodocyclaceae bacterium]|nr:hypothetical protein [Rhodocyclaceae bacterium]